MSLVTCYHLEVKPVITQETGPNDNLVSEIDNKIVGLLDSLDIEHLPDDFDPEHSMYAPLSSAAYKQLRSGFGDTASHFAVLRDQHYITLQWLARRLSGVTNLRYTESNFWHGVAVTNFSGEGFFRDNNNSMFFDFLVKKLGADYNSLYQEFIDSKNTQATC